jgi:hypothetical protein
MAAIAGRTRRGYGTTWVLMQARVDPEVRERAHRGAAVRGVSVSRYMQMLIEQDELADSYVPPEPLPDTGEQLDMSA